MHASMLVFGGSLYSHPFVRFPPLLSFFQCLSAYAKALQLNPLNRTAALKMAEVLTAQGKEEEAVAW